MTTQKNIKERSRYYDVLINYSCHDVAYLITDFIVWLGAIFDVLDSESIWYAGIIVNEIGDKVKVHFIGWSPAFREDFFIGSNKIQPFGTHTKKKVFVRWSTDQTHIRYVEVGYWISQCIELDKWKRIMHIDRDAGNKIRKNIFQGIVVFIDDHSIIVQHEDKISTISKTDKKFQILSARVPIFNWTCPECDKFLKKLEYYCENCGYTI